MKPARKTSDALLLDAFIQEYRGFIPVRLTTVAAITAMIAVFASPVVAALYGLAG